MSDQILAEIASTPVSTIEEVVAVMQQIDGLLADEDGLKWFNLLYLKVTEAVLERPPENGWSAPEWLARLDVIFAGLYFEALRNWISLPASAPKSWQVLFDARAKSDLIRLQFALCGMNAHMNRDLQLALVQTNEEFGIEPELNSPQHRDFQIVNGLLESVEAEIKPILAVGIVDKIDKSFGRIDDILAMWSVGKARDTAWINSEFLWLIRNIPFARRKKMEATDNITGVVGRGLLLPVV